MAPPAATRTPAPSAPVPAAAVPLAATLTAWVQQHLGPRGYSRPVSKRLALLLTGLLAGERASLAGLAATLAPLTLPAAQEPSIVRRLSRTLADPRLDAARLLPDLLGPLLPDLLADAVGAHAANAALPPAHHQRFRPVRLILDESSVEDRLHVLLVGLAVGGVVLPLGLRSWPQNQPLAEGAYWASVTDLLSSVQALLPAVLRDHVLLLADRAYGVPRLVDVCAALGWGYVVRLQGQVVVQWPDGTEQPVRTLAPRPGTTWWATVTDPLAPSAAGAAAGADSAAAGAAVDPPLRLFKQAGWRSGRVVAAWVPEQAEPWLLLTNLSSAPERVQEYAQRWAIERTFLSWKSHGWDIEAVGRLPLAALGRLLGVLSLATLWRLVCALPVVEQQLGRPRTGRWPPRQLRLPWDGATAPARPTAAKASLLTWGRKALQGAVARCRTPAQQWTLPAWTASGTWSAYCAEQAARL